MKKCIFLFVSHASPIEALWCGVNATDVDSLNDCGRATYHNGSIGMNPYYSEWSFLDWVEFPFNILVQYENILTRLVIVLDSFPVLSGVVVKNILAMVVSGESPVGEIS